jgi:hypothetical protein
MRVVEETRSLSDELGLTGRHVFFNEEWVPYEQRADWLLEADVGVTTHRLHVESRFAFRTRVLDYLWAGLPILCTAGDALADTVEASRLGITVSPGDPGAVASALRRLADPGLRAEISGRVAEHARSLTWSRTAAPLLAFCAAPSHAPDRRAGGVEVPVPVAATAPPPVARADRLLRRVGQELAEGGAGAVARAALRWMRRRGARIAGRTGTP